MAIRYTGRASVFVVNGVAYKPGDIVPLSKREALAMAARTNLHTFEDVPDPSPAKPEKASPDRS